MTAKGLLTPIKPSLSSTFGPKFEITDYGLQNCINCLIQLEINLQLVRPADRIEWSFKAK